MRRIYDCSNLGGSGAGGGIPEAPADGKLYGRQSAAWVEIPEAEAYIPPRPGEPGSIVFLKIFFGGGTPGDIFMHMGQTRGSDYLDPAVAFSETSGGALSGKIESVTLSGTWAVAGVAVYGDNLVPFLRVDNPSILSALKAPHGGRDIIRNLRYSRADGGTINCEVYFAAGRYEQLQWHEFTANPADPAPWGMEIFRRALDGVFGDVEPWREPEQ